tara:strand:+ start:2284 stop:3201 length:918 start_codon:yes stop_codon:yes gene_type:complete
MMMLKEGSKGPEVIQLQKILGVSADGNFGPGTKKAVIRFQLGANLPADGIVGNDTWSLLLTRGAKKEAIDEDTDVQGQFYTTNYNQLIHKHFLPKNEYIKGPIKNLYMFIHHTAGWEDPYKCIDSWGRDDRGAIATEFVMGGQKVTTGDDTHDGVMVQAFAEGNQGWQLGKTGSGIMNRQSVGIEICNFGYLTNELKTYAGQKAHESQVCKLAEPFKGYTNWHNYSTKQIAELEKWLKYIADRDNIDLRIGLVQWIKKQGPTKAFGYQDDAYYGKVKGLLTHTNVRKDKFDCYPHPDLIDMLLSL